MFDPRYTTIITGAAAQLGVRLLPLLRDFSVYAADVVAPETDAPLRLELMDVGREACCRQLVDLLRDTGAANVVHLAFADPASGSDSQRMWQINVAGPARVMEAVTEVNRMGAGAVRKFVFVSSAAAYGPALPYAVKEDTPLAGQGLPCALHKQEADEVVQLRAPALGACSTYILRPQTCAGTAEDDCVLRGFRGVPAGKGRLAAHLRRQHRRMPIVVPSGAEYLERHFQFVHVDDLARLIAFILRRPERSPGLQVLNVTGRGHALTFRRCAEISGASIRRLPVRFLCRWATSLAWSVGASPIPPEALPYLLAPPIVDTTRLRAFLGNDYEQVIQRTMEDAFTASFRPSDDRPVPGGDDCGDSVGESERTGRSTARCNKIDGSFAGYEASGTREPCRGAELVTGSDGERSPG